MEAITTPKKLINQKKSPKSPKFMKPSEVFKMRKKKRLSLSPSASKSPSKLIFSPLKCLQYQKSPRKDLTNNKFFSPFKLRKTPIKRNKHRNGISVSAKRPTPNGKRQLNFVGHTVPTVIDIDDENANLEAANGGHISDIQQPQCLIDWSLKTKLCFMSSAPFPFRGNFRATEEATGISSFVRCVHNASDITADPNSIASQPSQPLSDSIDISFASVLHKQCLVWSHPNLPWLTLYPRNGGHSVPGTPSAFKAPIFSIMPNTPLADALHSDWCSSLKSVYQMLKAKHCAYFYVCANSFTVLFRASGVAGCDDVQVMVSPTTSGLRKLITREGISFEMPYQSKSDAPVISGLEDLIHNDDNVFDDDDSDVFLESLGLSQQDFPSLQAINRKNRSSSTAVSRSKSLLLIKGMTNSQLFINFLMNTRVCVANSGPLSGVPPTLLSPVAFHGSTLQSLKLRQTKSNQNMADSYHCLEISGPLLPNSVIGLINLLKESQKCLKASFTSYEHTIPFASCDVTSTQTSVTSVAFAKENLKDCGLEKEFLNYICSDEHQSKHAINDLVCNNSHVIYIDNFDR